MWGNLFDEMPLRRFDGMEECGFGECGGNGEGRCLGMGEGIESSEFEGFGIEDFKEFHCGNSKVTELMEVSL